MKQAFTLVFLFAASTSYAGMNCRIGEQGGHLEPIQKNFYAKAFDIGPESNRFIVSFNQEMGYVSVELNPDGATTTGLAISAYIAENGSFRVKAPGTTAVLELDCR